MSGRPKFLYKRFQTLNLTTLSSVLRWSC